MSQSPSVRTPRVVVVAGVSGSGKSTIGRLLAARRGGPFIDGDDLHSPENIAKMKTGVALSDADRAPWLAAVAARLDQWTREGASGTLACSALKRSYRDFLRDGRPNACVVLLLVDDDAVRERLKAREGHFMPAALLDSQLATLEPPGPDEPGIVGVDASAPSAVVLERVATALAALDSP